MYLTVVTIYSVEVYAFVFAFPKVNEIIVQLLNTCTPKHDYLHLQSHTQKLNFILLRFPVCF